ncbi:MAG: ribonuclease HII [Tissierellia bacterium]|nr:ribonuclease HII [Tissierellia bacterium]
MYGIEMDYYNKGVNYIACVDEVGRGCLFGDVVSCAVVMPRDSGIEKVMDSKKLSAKRREELSDLILSEAIAVGIGRVDSKLIDEINIKQATILSMKKALSVLSTRNGDLLLPELILVDAEKFEFENVPVISIIKGDEKSYGIAAASIVAKVHRDSLCQDWDEYYPEYKIGKNKGYGTKEHVEAIKLNGPSEMHRKSFLTKIGGRI